MWKKLFAAGAAWAASAGTALAQFDAPGSTPASALSVFRSSAADPAGVGGLRRPPSFAAPLPPGPGMIAVPAGGVLAAPVITPFVTKHGRLKFDVLPVGADGDTPSVVTRHPDRHLAEACAGLCEPCPPGPRAWVAGEFLYWATQGVAVPPLVVAAQPGPFGSAGLLNQPGTRVLFGGDRLLDRTRPGFRLEAGTYFGCEREWGASGRFFFLGSVADGLAGGSDGTTILALPQLVPGAGGPVEVPVYVGFPGLIRGTLTADVQTNFLGADANLRRALTATDGCRVDLVGGYRYLHLGDRLATTFDSALATDPPTIATRVMGADNVRTRNHFHGGQLGVSAFGRRGPFSIDVLTTVALGVTVSDLDASRTRTVGAGGFPLLVPPADLAGLVDVGALPPGAVVPVVQTATSDRTNYFAVVPEVGVRLGWHPTEHLRLTAGYNFLYWSRVRRAPEQYTLSPVLRSEPNDFWAQGFNLGLELRY
jgi:hypothetical protein